MSGYNEAFDFNAIAGAHGTRDMPGYLNAAPAIAQSETWSAAPYAPSGLMEGDTAAPLHARLDFAPFEGAEPNGTCSQTTCAVCLSRFQNAFALDSHAKEATHQAYRCKCGTGFSKHSALKRHIDTKDAPKTFACTLCYDKFARKDKLKDHCRHYHKVTDEGLRALFNAQESKPRGAASRRRRAPIPLAAAPSGPAPTQASAPPPPVAPAPAGQSFWSPPACTGQQYGNLSAGPFIRPGPLAPASSFDWAAPFISAADELTAAPVPTEDISGTSDIFGDDSWATGFDGFDF